MKKSILFGCIIMICISCENIHNESADQKDSIEAYLFKSNSELLYKYIDFELYDSSAHIFYFKDNHPEFKSIKSSGFSLLANGEEIYKGVFSTLLSSSLPNGAYILKILSFYPEYTFRIEFGTIDNQPPDTRNDPRLISCLKDHELLHSGLLGEIKSIIRDGSQFTFTFVVTNFDKSDLLILDPMKMGPKLFHYFTNAPIFYNKTQNMVFRAITESQSPSASADWHDWLSPLNSGESLQFSFTYNLESPLNSGDYLVSYEFPGLNNQVTKDQLYLDNKRVWLGDILLKKTIVIE